MLQDTGDTIDGIEVPRTIRNAARSKMQGREYDIVALIGDIRHMIEVKSWVPDYIPKGIRRSLASSTTTTQSGVVKEVYGQLLRDLVEHSNLDSAVEKIEWRFAHIANNFSHGGETGKQAIVKYIQDTINSPNGGKDIRYKLQVNLGLDSDDMKNYLLKDLPLILNLDSNHKCIT